VHILPDARRVAGNLAQYLTFTVFSGDEGFHGVDAGCPFFEHRILNIEKLPAVLPPAGQYFVEAHCWLQRKAMELAALSGHHPRALIPILRSFEFVQSTLLASHASSDVAVS